MRRSNPSSRTAATDLIFRRAIEWAFESALQPVVKLSPWPYQYDAAFMVRHDLENYVSEIAHVSDSAQYEYQHRATGDYYFCTGTITNAGVDFATIVAGLQSAVNSCGATIGPHNGGLPNPKLSDDTNSICHFLPDQYQYFHWGPDEPLDMPGGYSYASSSVAISFTQIEAWVTNQPSGLRVWVVPYFNGTREDSYKIQQQLDVKITGEQKLSPFPHWNLSTRTDGKLYSFLSEPVSDWFVGSLVAQVVGPWQDHGSGPGVHTTSTLQTAVDFYYTNGFLINFYSHSLTSVTNGDQGGAANLMADYVSYCTNHARIWSANAKSLYAWWLNRSTALVTATYTTNGTHSVAMISITGAQDTNTTVEIFGPGSQPVVIGQLRTNTALADTNSYRTINQLIKIKVGTTVTNVQIEYFPGPVARSDSYVMSQGQSLTIATNSGVLTNDWAGAWSGLRATTNSLPQHGSLSWNANGDGGFAYTPTNTFTGPDCFTYLASDGTNSFGQANVTVFVSKSNTFFSDDFAARCSALDPIAPWKLASAPWSGQWTIGGVLQGSSQPGNYAYCYFDTNWTSYAAQAKIQFPAGAFGGGIGGRLNPANGAHYGAWIYPEGSIGGSNTLALVKFTSWDTWSFLQTTNLASVGTTNHIVKLTFNGSQINVYYDDLINSKITATDSAYASGGVTSEMWTYTNPYSMSVRELSVTNYP